MKEELNKVIIGETEAVNELLESLENQFQCMLKSDAVSMELCTKKIQECNRKIAEFEVKRREITKGEPMRKVIEQINDNEIDNNFRKMKKLLQAAIQQKDTNDLLIKQGLAFTNRMMNILNPDRKAKTYNAYGKIQR
ncbi:MAG: flagellar protein FlgN [Bacillota bacterium]|nr:flagellar protein FlgN [Bacillota bacterium]